MADDVRIETPGPNGEKLTLDLKERRIGLSTRDLLPLLVVIGAFVGGLLVAKILFLGQMQGQQALSTLAQTVHELREAVMGRLHDQGAHFDDVLRSQNAQVQEQTQELRKELQAQNTLVTEQSAQLRQWLDILMYNLDRSIEQRLPLSAPPGSVPVPSSR